MKPPFKVAVASSYEDLGPVLLRCMGAEKDGSVLLDERRIVLNPLAGSLTLRPEGEDVLQAADAVLVPIRFLDRASIDKAKTLLASLRSIKESPLAFLILREEQEPDFKMSCPHCGQKLWVRDGDEGKQGRCPSCQKAFSLPSQAKHLRAQLALPKDVPVRTACHADPLSSRQAVLKALMDLIP